MHCVNCGSPLAASDRFCPKCGASVAAAGSSFSGAAAPPGTTPVSGQPEDKARRILAFLVDIIPALFLVVLNFIPFLDWLAGLAAAAYWLLRDFNGQSPGKMVLGSVVVSANGGPSTTNQRILRNVTLAVPGLIAAIPFIGVYLAAPISIIAFFGEVVMLLVTGRRVGDMLANTTVVRK